MSICEMVKTQKQYYLCNMRSTYFLSIGDCVCREREKEQKRERERLCPSVKQ